MSLTPTGQSRGAAGAAIWQESDAPDDNVRARSPAGRKAR
jgi:hypothetical protein